MHMPMETTMELDELKQAWQTLDRHLARQHDLQWQILRDRKLDKVRDHLRPHRPCAACPPRWSR